ncbi:zona pellucida sperm-binding protein 3-like [Xyrichtys novacula]|uniref:Zona pellucida sperm-binding protein 3 n=1 Tax=Xyrichtys novacula TaxID=13765 RepID=A0AAV1GGP5_XYRNO|nr:zona pellucida sperm-binding protein 3-like [Xyrichtys novacula]
MFISPLFRLQVCFMNSNQRRLLTAAEISPWGCGQRPSFQTSHRPKKMDRILNRNRLWWITFLISVYTLTETRSINNQAGFSTTSSQVQSRPHGNFQTQQNGVKLRPRSVVVHCYPDYMEVVVQADMFNMGLQVEGRHLHLGSDTVAEGGACGAEPSGEAEFTIRTKLLDCGTSLSSTKERIIYSNVLVYSPEPSLHGLLRLDGASIPVECHYEKKYAVGGVSLQPTWVPFVSKALAENQIDFNLLLMTDDWQYERGSNSYFLGDPINFQVSASIRNHVPLRVYVDHCVATATPDAEATLRYDFIEHHGCLADAYLTNSRSHFLPRVEEHKLRFQLDAFRFNSDHVNQVYITCYLKAVPVGSAVSSRNRACSLIDNSWRSVDGNDQACRSCDISHRAEEPPPTEPPTTTTTTTTTTTSTKSWTPQASLVQKKHEHLPATYYRVHPGMHQSQYNRLQQSPAGLKKRGTEVKAEQTVQMGPIIVLQTSKTDPEPTDSKASL